MSAAKSLPFTSAALLSTWLDDGQYFETVLQPLLTQFAYGRRHDSERNPNCHWPQAGFVTIPWETIENLAPSATPERLVAWLQAPPRSFRASVEMTTLGHVSPVPARRCLVLMWLNRLNEVAD